MRRRLQNRIAESTLTLPLAAVVATLLWWLPQGGYTAMALRSWAATASGGKSAGCIRDSSGGR